MSLINSPSFDSPETDIDPVDDPNHSDQLSGNLKFRLLLIVFLGLGLLLVVANIFVSSGQLGSVKGTVMDADGQPIYAEIYVLGSEEFVFTDDDGDFLLQNIPIGSQGLIISYNTSADIVPIKIPFAGTVDIGTIEIDVSVLDG